MDGDNLEFQANLLKMGTQKESLISETWKL